MPSRVALTMIVKDEEPTLARCLESMRGLFEETVIVDTGSTDRTKQIAARFGARVFDFVWCDDFSAARNEGLRHATSPWIFWLDGDEWLDPDNRERLRRLFDGLGDENVAYVMTQMSYRQPALYRGASDTPRDTPAEQVRLFRNHPEIRWKYRVYEQVFGSISALGGTAQRTDVVIGHAGYEDIRLYRAKNERNLALAQMEHEENPHSAYVVYTLGVFQLALGRPAEATLSFQRALELLVPGATFGPKLFFLLGESLRASQREHEALGLCRVGRLHYPDDPELVLQENDLGRAASDTEGARSLVARLEETRQARLFPDTERAQRAMARHGLAWLLRGCGEIAEAEAQWRAAIDAWPEFARAWLELGELYLESGRWAELDRIIARLEVGLQRADDAAVLRARGLMARRRYTEARQLLESTITASPKSVRARLILSQVLLFEGRDWAAAEGALLDVLALDPNNVQAQHNLAILRKRKGG